MVKVALTVEGDTGAVISALRQLAVGDVASPAAFPEIIVASETAPRLAAAPPDTAAPAMTEPEPPPEPEPEPPVPEGDWSIDHVRRLLELPGRKRPGSVSPGRPQQRLCTPPRGLAGIPRTLRAPALRPDVLPGTRHPPDAPQPQHRPPPPDVLRCHHRRLQNAPRRRRRHRPPQPDPSQQLTPWGKLTSDRHPVASPTLHRESAIPTQARHPGISSSFRRKPESMCICPQFCPYQTPFRDSIKHGNGENQSDCARHP